MAAYAALTSLSQATHLLHNIILQSITRTSAKLLLLPQLENKIEFLHKNTHFLRSFIEKSPTNKFEAQIKDAADQAEGIIGRFVLEHLRSKLEVNDVILEGLCHGLERIHQDIISSMVDNINGSVCQEVSDEESIGILDSSSSRLIPLTRNEEIIGFGRMFSELSCLVFEASSTELGMVSIVGMGGIGKTTLARKLYNHSTTSELFEIIGWVTVSQDFSARDILVSLMASIQPYVRYPKERTESIENHVRKNLKGRRFLIVLDDVWSQEALRFLMRTFPDDGNRSRILLTTRQKEIVYDANPNKLIFMMRFMTRDDSYELLLRKVFQEDHCPPELEIFLMIIAGKCDGLPLAIVLVAGILFATNRSLPEWEYVAKKITSFAYGDTYEMVDFILSLSYIHLPHRLRSCLLYLGAFPEDHEINVSRVTKQLLVQDFLQNSTGSEAEECLQDLVKRNLVSVLKWKSDDRIKSICLHDMVRDFFLKKAQEEKLLHYVTDSNCNQELTGRKIKVTSNLGNLKRSCISDGADETRTIMCFGRGRTTRSPLTSIGRFRQLKSLDLESVEIESFPMEVLELFLLRLLSLGHVPELPPSISNLQYLETIMINAREPSSSSSMTLAYNTLPRILCLPFEVWAMPHLRHIVSFCCGVLPSPKQENPPLENLETLSAVMNLDCTKELMEMIPNVKKLVIFYFSVERATHSIENIKCLHNLKKLKVWVLVPFSSPQNLDLGFPRTLQKLTLRGIQLSNRDMDIIGQLPHLQVLKLRHNDFERDEWRITRDGFRNLKYLLLKELGLRHWWSDHDHNNDFVLPKLQTLVIRTCNKLNEVPVFVESIPSLELIEVVGCNESLVGCIRIFNNQNPNLLVRIKNYG